MAQLPSQMTPEEIRHMAETSALRTAVEAVKQAAFEADREIVRELVRESVKETLIGLGIDPGDPIEAQKDAAFIREFRLSMTQVKRHGMLTLWGAMLLGIATLVWMQIKGP